MPSPGEDEVLVQTVLSGVSGGTELLLFRGEIPAPEGLDLDPIAGSLAYPTTFGYCAVGRVLQIGADVDPGWQGRLVFGFQPHASHFVAPLAALIPAPQGVTADAAVFLANLETAVNIVQDTGPLLGERILVLGQGVVGLLTAALLRKFPLELLLTADLHAIRRQASKDLGATVVLDPASPDFRSLALSHTGGTGIGFDAIVELTGNPSAVNDAIALAAYSARIVMGSWFGSKAAPLELGGRYHRRRVRLISSQVSTIAPELRGRWDKSRRFRVAWDTLGSIRPERWITHRFPFERAAEAYSLLDESPEKAIQVVLTYN